MSIVHVYYSFERPPPLLHWAWRDSTAFLITFRRQYWNPFFHTDKIPWFIPSFSVNFRVFFLSYSQVASKNCCINVYQQSFTITKSTFSIMPKSKTIPYQWCCIVPPSTQFWSSSRFLIHNSTNFPELDILF